MKAFEIDMENYTLRKNALAAIYSCKTLRILHKTKTGVRWKSIPTVAIWRENLIELLKALQPFVRHAEFDDEGDATFADVTVGGINADLVMMIVSQFSELCAVREDLKAALKAKYDLEKQLGDE